MNENLNLVEILKDCPKGTKLYSTIFGEVTLDKIKEESKHPIIFITTGGNNSDVTADGRYYDQWDGECTLFPSKDQRDWSKFNPKKDGLVSTCEFKDGDILSYQYKGFNNRSIYIYRYHERFNTSYYIALSGDTDAELMIDNIGKWALNGYNDTARFATEEEKQKLFKAIKNKGYKWNAETKTLEKLVEPKFDPKTLQPFDKVLVRDNSLSCWRCSFYSHLREIDESLCRYAASERDYLCCIPYNDKTKHLLGTSDEAPEYYRYWED